jgi:RNA polymerase sigma-70 factor (sigma-E family)
MSRSRPSFDDFFAENAAGLLRTAYLLSSDEQEAEDLVQECFLKVSRRWVRVAAMGHPLAYARRMLVNLALRGSKSRGQRQAELELPFVDTSWDSDWVAQVVARDELRTALDQLTPRQRAILVLRYFDDLSDAQVAKALGCSVGTVKSTASRSLRQLRKLLESEPPQEGALAHDQSN